MQHGSWTRCPTGRQVGTFRLQDFTGLQGVDKPPSQPRLRVYVFTVGSHTCHSRCRDRTLEVALLSYHCLWVTLPSHTHPVIFLCKGFANTETSQSLLLRGVRWTRRVFVVAFKKGLSNHRGYHLIDQGPAICQGIYTFYLKKFTVFIIHNY